MLIDFSPQIFEILMNIFVVIRQTTVVLIKFSRQSLICFSDIFSEITHFYGRAHLFFPSDFQFFYAEFLGRNEFCTRPNRFFCGIFNFLTDHFHSDFLL